MWVGLLYIYIYIYMFVCIYVYNITYKRMSKESVKQKTTPKWILECFKKSVKQNTTPLGIK